MSLYMITQHPDWPQLCSEIRPKRRYTNRIEKERTYRNITLMAQFAAQAARPKPRRRLALDEAKEGLSRGQHQT